MRRIGIDYGEKKTGVAYSEGKLAEPLAVVRHESERELIEKLKVIITKEEIGEIVVGVSEGMMGKKQRKFGERLAREIGLVVVFEDETLTTEEAQRLSIEAGIKRKKRRKLEDAYAATLILQRWIDRGL